MFWRLNWAMAGLFLLSVVVQYNDPDPVRWMAIYGAALVVCLVLGVRGRIPIAVPAIVAAIALAWGIDIMFGNPVVTAYAHMFDAWEMKSAPIEEAREATGLFIAGGWMLAAAIRQWRRGR